MKIFNSSFSIFFKKLIVVTPLIFFNSLSYSQYDLVRPINNKLREMFSQITFPDTSVQFLYERSVNMTDSTLYSHYNENDTLNTEEWYMLYEEMYFASHDTTTQIPVKTIKDEINQFQNDTINFGIMHWNSYHLKQVSLQSGNYLIFDTVNNRIYDHPSPLSSPYQLDSLFLAAPLSNTAYFRNVTYRITPTLIFRGSKTYNQLKNYTLQIDFGDGMGFRVINSDIESYISLTYSSDGEKIIRTRLYSKTEIRS